MAKKPPCIKSVFNENIIDVIDKVDCDILYLDPPYTKNKYSVQYHLLETLRYNDGKRGFNGWSPKEEKRLIEFVDEIKKKGCKIVMSNILEYKEKTNDLLIKWIEDNNASVKEITVRGRKEVLISYEASI